MAFSRSLSLLFLISLHCTLLVASDSISHVPQVVFPRRAASALPISSNSSEYYRRILQSRRHKKPIESSAERSKQHHSRIVFAPVDDAKIVTAEDYAHYDTQPISSAAHDVPTHSVDFEDVPVPVVATSAHRRPTAVPMWSGEVRMVEGPRTTTHSPITTTTTALNGHNLIRRTTVGGFRGQSLVAEIDPDQKRTTMAESSMDGTVASTPASTTVSSTPRLITLSPVPAPTVKSGFIKVRAHQRPIVLSGDRNGITREISSEARAIANFAAVGRPKSEKRFPAERWQIPPSLATRNFNEDRRIQLPPSHVNNFNTRQAMFDSQVQWPRPQQPPPSPFLPLQPLPQVPPSFGIQASFSPQAPLLQPQGPLFAPPPTSIPPTTPHPQPASDVQPHIPFRTSPTRPKFRATFAKHNDRIKPIPLPAGFIQENDMDLLSPQSPQQLSSSPTGGSGGDPVPIPLPPPVMPVTTTFGQQGPLPEQQQAVSQPAQPATQLDPNGKLALCCQKQGLSESCQNLCNFDTFTDRTLVSTFLTNQCPEPQRSLAFQCATTRVDHSDCCRRNNLHLYAGGQCMPFCVTNNPTPANVFSYLPCLQVFDTIKNCYKEYQYTHPNIFGD